MTVMSAIGKGENPLARDSQAAWDELITRVDAASILLTIQEWLGPTVQRWHTAEDVWQDTLLAAWGSRQTLEWRGPGAFRRWLLEIARHRVQDLGEHVAAVKRGKGREVRLADLKRAASSSSASHYAGPEARTTPDRLAMDRERAETMARAIAVLPADLLPVVRLRLFEDLPIQEIADRLGIGAEAVRSRFRKGAGIYRRALRRAGATPTGESSEPLVE
jgi:RNA polymerase sigma factor (sigma-70 family)